MRTASDLAEWWDKQHAISKQALDEFVDENPGLFGVVLATAVATAMEVGKGTVDVLRLGEGLAEGGVSGIGTDALRAMSIVGTVGKGAKIIKEVVGRSKMMQLIVDPGARALQAGGGQRCVFVSATQALRQTGQKAYASVDEFAKALGMTLDDFGNSGGRELRNLLQILKVKVGPIMKPTSWKQIEKAVPRDGGVFSFGFKFKPNEAHRVYAFRDAFGTVKIMDRGGTGKLPRVFDTLDDLVKHYGKTGIEHFNDSFVIKDLFLKFVGPKGLATLAMEVLATTTGDAETTEQMFEAFQQEKKGELGRKPARIQLDTAFIKAGEPLPGGSYVVKRGDSLSKIAERAYGNMMKYPVIYMANKRKIGPNPNLIQPGQELLIPVLS
jgi:hypothetical protein